ncbi:MAG TPA: STAS domain-containing protein [Rectinemataceae bacterium]|nr:STAS domain-containing protein [Rectinemataceae bacterium]
MSAGNPDDDLARRLAGFGAAHPGSKLSGIASRKPPSLVIRIEGILDSSNSSAFQNAVTDCLEESRRRGGLILDLEGLSYASSTGVGAMTALLIETQRHKIPFRLCNIPHNVGAVLDILGFSSFLEIVDRYEVEE